MDFIDFFLRFQLAGGMTMRYFLLLLAMAITTGLLMAVAFIFTAFVTKKGRVLSFFSAILNMITLIIMPFIIRFFHSTPFFTVIYANSSQSAVEQMLKMYISMIPMLILSLIMSAFMFASFMTTIFSSTNAMSVKPKVVGVFALITLIVRYWTAVPYDFISPFIIGQVTPFTQFIAYAIYLAAYAFPAFLIFIAGVIALIKKIVNASKAKKNPIDQIIANNDCVTQIPETEAEIKLTEEGTEA